MKSLLSHYTSDSPENNDGGNIAQQSQKSHHWNAQALAVELDLVNHLNDNQNIVIAALH